MDALLPPLNPLYMIELPAPPELNENTGKGPEVKQENGTSGEEDPLAKDPCLQDTQVSSMSEDERRQSEVSEEGNVMPENVPVEGDSLMTEDPKDTTDDSSFHSAGDNVPADGSLADVSQNVSAESAQLEEATGVSDSADLSVEDVFIDDMEDGPVPEEINALDNPEAVQYVDHEAEEVPEDSAEPQIQECSVVLDSRVVKRYFWILKKRKEMAAARLMTEAANQFVQGETRASRESTQVQSIARARSSVNSRLVCKECKETFIEARSLRGHFRIKHPDCNDEFISACGRIGQFSHCPLCKQSYQMKALFLKHMFLAHSMTRSVFEKIDTYDEELLADFVAMHMKKMEENAKPAPAPPPPPEPRRLSRGIKQPPQAEGLSMLKCNFCSRFYNTNEGVYRHMLVKHRSEYDAMRKEATISSAPPHQKPAPVPPAVQPRKKPAAPVPPAIQPRKKPPAPAPLDVQPRRRPSVVTKVAPPAKVEVVPDPAPAPPPPLNKVLHCEWCRDRMKTTTQLNTHLRSKHSVPENMSSDGCNLPEFFTAMELHFYVVEREENCYECVSCKETFLEKVGLLEHFSGEHLKSRVVGMQIKLECSICSHKDSDVGNLHDHMWNEHANQKLEEIVMRVSDVRKNHRCGQECTLLWKKPVVSVEAAPRRVVAQKRPSTAVAAQPRPEKVRRIEPEVNDSLDDDDEEMRRLEEMEEKKLRDQEKKRLQLEKLKEEKRLKEEEVKRKKRESYHRIKAQKEQEKNAAQEQLKVKVKPMPERSTSGKAVGKTMRCLLCYIQCEDMEKHITEVHGSSVGGIKRSIESRRKPPEVSSPVESQTQTRPSSSRQSFRKSQPLVETQVARCRNCKVSFPDIVSMMKHQFNCRMMASPPSAAPGPSREPPAPKAAVEKTKSGQFVLMDDEDMAASQGFNCTTCRRKYATVGEWQAHIQEKHLENDASCELCYMTFKDHKGLNTHLNTAHQVYYPCVPCGTTYSNKKNFLQHVTNEHKLSKSMFNGISLANVDAIVQIFEQNGFHKQSSRPRKVVRPEPDLDPSLFVPEIKMESPDMPVMYQCELCNACYNTQEEIKEHMQYVH